MNLKATRMALLTLLIFSFSLTTNAYADEVILAEAPGNMEVINDVSENTITDISTDRSNEGNETSVPSIIYAPDSDSGRNSVSIAVDLNGSVGSFNEADAGSKETSRIIRVGDQQSQQSTSSGNVTEEVEVYIPDSDDDCPVSSAVPLPIELQEYLWTKCKKATGDYKNYYAFCLGVMEHESSFRAKATHHNSNGSTDRGIMQINSSNIGKMKRAGFISSAEDLYNAYKCIDCGVHMLNNYIGMFGVSESAYYAYNTGRERQGSNKNSRIVMKYMAKWNATVFG